MLHNSIASQVASIAPPSPTREQNFLAQACFALQLSLHETASLTHLPIPFLESLSTSPLFQSEVTRLRERFALQLVTDAKQFLHKEVMQSLMTLTMIRDNPALNVRERRLAAIDILDRVPETSKQHHITHSGNAQPQLTDKQFATLLQFINDDHIAKQAFDEAAKQLDGPMIDLNNEDFVDISFQQKPEGPLTRSNAPFVLQVEGEEENETPYITEDVEAAIQPPAFPASIKVEDSLKQFLF
jgi:hypothetical protein